MMEQLYKGGVFDSTSKFFDKREIIYNFSNIFPDDQKESDIQSLQSYLDLIEDQWNLRTGELGHFPLPAKIELVDLLIHFFDTLKDCSEIQIEHYPESFYHFVTDVFQSYEDDYILELIINIILYSNCEFDDILIPFFDNFKFFLQSKHLQNQEGYLEMCNRYVFDDSVFQILCQNQIHYEIFTIIQTSASLINSCFEFLYNYLLKFRDFNGIDIITEDLIEILKITLEFIQTSERDEFLSHPFLLLNTFMDGSNEGFLEKAKEFGLHDIFSFLFKKEDPSVFLASARLLNEFWKDCDLFDDAAFYERFQSIIEEQYQLINLGNFLFFHKIEIDPQEITSQEKIQLIGIDVLRDLVPDHLEQFYKYEIVEIIVDNCQKYSFQLKKSILLLFYDYLYHSSIETRRNLISRMEENSIYLIINAIESDNYKYILNTVTTLILMIDQDPEFWIDLVTSENIIDEFENVFESTDDGTKKIIQQFLTYFNSQIPEEE